MWQYIKQNWVVMVLIIILVPLLAWALPIAFGNGSVAYPNSQGAGQSFQNAGYKEVQVGGPQYFNLINVCGKDSTVYFEVSGLNVNNQRVNAYVCGRTFGGYWTVSK